MDQKIVTFLFYFWELLWVINGLNHLHLDVETTNFWEAFGRCLIELPAEYSSPNYIFCDPDNTLKEDDIPVLSSHMKVCSEKMLKEGRSAKVVILAVNNINITGHGTKIADIDMLMNFLKTQWAALMTDPTYLVIVEKGNKEIREWYSESAMRTENSDQQPQQILQEQVWINHTNFIINLIILQETVCQLMDSFLGVIPFSFGLHSMLWIIFSSVIIIGSFVFGCWIYRFHKSHPTIEETDNFEMTLQDAFFDDDGKPLPTVSSGFVLAHDEIEAASPDPAKSTTHDSLNRI